MAKAMICERCGGTINPKTHRCEYCGTYYEKEDIPIVLNIDNTRAEVLRASFSVDNEALSRDKDFVMHYVGREITMKLAEALNKYVEFYVQEDMDMDRHTVTGRVRVLPPNYRF